MSKYTPEELEVGISRTSADLNDKYDMPMGRPGKIGRYTKSAKPITKTEQFRTAYVTHNKHPLTYREARFIDAYMQHGDKAKAVEEAGFDVKNKAGKGQALLKKDYIADEIAYRTEIYASECVANRQELMEFYTAAMRGEIQDQFGLDPTLTDRLRAADSLKKVLIDDVERGKQVHAQQVVVNIDMNRDTTDGESGQTVSIEQISD